MRLPEANTKEDMSVNTLVAEDLLFPPMTRCDGDCERQTMCCFCSDILVLVEFLVLILSLMATSQLLTDSCRDNPLILVSSGYLYPVTLVLRQPNLN